MSEQFSAYEASQPGTDPEVLARIVDARPDLRPLVAANPSTPRPVLERLAALGDVAVDAALARRAGGPVTPGPAPARPDPFAPPAARDPFAPPAGAPAPPAGAYGQPGGYGAAPAQPGAPSPYAAQPSVGPIGGSGAAQPGGPTYPYAGPYGAPGQAGPYATGPYAPAPGQRPTDPYGPSPYSAGPYGAPYGPPRTSSRAVVWVILAAVLVIALIVVGAVFAFRNVADIIPSGPAESEGGSYGTNAELDRLWDACEAGDGGACDDLFFESPAGSEYEEFGATCGNRLETTDLCEGQI